jgi:glycerol-3-phosphate O-acyltransferase/dihydroxyacetone phosphate acyltransferase
LGIFPEGGSHDQSDLLPLKVGVAICGLGAMSQYKGTKIKVVACGLKYFKPSKFRSSMILEYSAPFEVDPELVQEYVEDKRQACSKLLAKIERTLRTVTFSAPSYKELRAIYLARRLYLPTSQAESYTEEEINELYKRFFKGYQTCRGEQVVEEIMTDIYDYGNDLKSLGFKDSQVYEKELSTLNLVRSSLVSLVKMVMSLIFVLPGMITLLPIGLINRVLAEKERRRAVIKSSVKNVGADVQGSTRILSTFVLYPLTCTFFTLLLYIIQRYNSDLSFIDCIWNCFYFLLFYPVYNYICVRSLDGVSDNWNNLFTIIFCLVNRDTMDSIRAKRADLSKRLLETINKFGPVVFKDFDKMKLVKNLKPRKNPLVNNDSNSEMASETSYFQLINTVDFDDAFSSLTELVF